MPDHLRAPWHAWVLAALTALLLVAAVIGYLDLHEERRHTEQRGAARELATLQAFELQQQLTRSLSAVYALASVLRQYGEISDFARLAHSLVTTYGGLSGLQLAPRGVVSQVYPLAGNQRALGHNLLEDPRRRDAALLAIQTGQLTLAGPFELLQGGTAVIGRLPVFGVVGQPRDAFWGFTIALVRVPLLLEAIDLDQLVRAGYNFELRNAAPASGDLSIIARSQAATLPDPVEVRVAVPNGAWSLGVAPLAGWPPPRWVPARWLLAMLVGLLGGWRVFLLLQRPYLLQRLVSARRQALEQANRSLDETLRSCRQAASELQLSRSRYHLLIENAGEMIVVHDTSGRMLEANRELRERLGYARDELAARQIGDLVRALPHAEYAPLRAAHADAGDVWPVVLVARDGTTVPVEPRSADVDLPGGRIYLTFFEDLSERLANEAALASTHQHLELRIAARRDELAAANARLAEELAERRRAEGGLLAAKQVAEEATATKSRFLANLSHEIRTPMNGLVGMLSLLGEEPLDAEHAGYVAAALDAGETLLVLIDDLLDLAKIEAGFLVLDPLPTEVREWAETLRTKFAGRAVRKRLAFRWRLASSLPAQLVIDPMRVGQILGNLVDNAIKFTDSGSIFVEIDHNSLVAPARLEIAVSDTGCGITDTFMDQLFTAFTKADDSLTRSQGGVGLGLALCHRLVTLMDGELTVTSRIGAGSRFHFWLPAAATVSLQGVAAEMVHGEQRTALVVEDDAVSQQVAMAMLQKLGWQTVLAGDGKAAVEAASAQSFQLILMDAQLPGMDGYQAARLIREREQPRGRRTIILGCSGNGGADSLIACRAAGMDGHLVKPLQLGRLRSTLGRWWQHPA